MLFALCIINLPQLTTLIRWEHGSYPTYFFPHSALSFEVPPLEPISAPPGVEIYDLLVGQTRVPGAILKYVKPGTALNGLFKISKWGDLDQ